jgi:hypothetical protein
VNVRSTCIVISAYDKSILVYTSNTENLTAGKEDAMPRFSLPERGKISSRGVLNIYYCAYHGCRYAVAMEEGGGNQWYFIKEAGGNFGLRFYYAL